MFLPLKKTFGQFVSTQLLLVFVFFVFGSAAIANGETQASASGPAAKEVKKEPAKEETKSAEPKKPEPTKPNEPKPDTVELKKEPLRLTVKLNGTFEPRQTEQIRLKGKEFTNFKLSEVIEHGRKVNSGEVLVQFEPKEYEDAFADRKHALRLSEIALAEEEANMHLLEQRKQMEKTAWERSKKYEDEDFVHFFDIEWPLQKRNMEMSMKSSQFSLDSAREELRQLEKMYRDDELVEETEEFILKRQKMLVEFAAFSHERQKLIADFREKFAMPRSEISIRESKQLFDLQFEKTRKTFDFSLEQAQIRFQKMKESHAKLVKQYNDFIADKAMLTLTAPMDGIVYYGDYNGDLTKGKWNNASAVAVGFRKGESVRNDQVLFTIVDPRANRLRFSVPEKELNWCKVESKGIVTPTAFPNTRLSGNIVALNDYPTVNGDYQAVLAVNVERELKIYPSMTGAVEFVSYENKEAFLVPTAALKREEIEDDSWNHAYLYTYETKTENNKEIKTVSKTKTKTGEVKGDKTELLGNFNVGDQVFKKFDDGEKMQEQLKKSEKEQAEKDAKEKADAEAKEQAEKAAKEKADAEAKEKSKEAKTKEKSAAKPGKTPKNATKEKPEEEPEKDEKEESQEENQ